MRKTVMNNENVNARMKNYSLVFGNWTDGEKKANVRKFLEQICS